MTPILVVACPKAGTMDAKRDRIPNAAIALKRIKPPTVLSMIAEPENYTTSAVAGSDGAISASHQKPHDRSRHEIGHGAGNHGAEAEFGELVTLVRRQSSNAADLYADGAEVGKAAESKSGDGNGPRVERGLHCSEV